MSRIEKMTPGANPTTSKFTYNYNASAGSMLERFLNAGENIFNFKTH
jgi:hypothetical protein